MFRNRCFLFIALSGLMMVLQGCTNMAMSSAQAYYNRHSLEKHLKDHYLAMQAYKNLYVKSDRFKDSHISIAAFNGELLLAGQTPTPEQKSRAEAKVRKISGIKQVYNLVKVASPTSSIIKISDTWITTKIKARFIASDEIDATRIKVVTENGAVYLMGIVDPEEGDAAATLASQVGGVREVVKIFSYLRISKNRNV